MELREIFEIKKGAAQMDGVKIHRRGWEKGMYITGGEIYFLLYTDHLCRGRWSPSLIEYFADDWEFYKEPKCEACEHIGNVALMYEQNGCLADDKKALCFLLEEKHTCGKDKEE